jgi:hypothetical protein
VGIGEKWIASLVGGRDVGHTASPADHRLRPSS